MKIAILGAGAFGTALGGILADNGYDIDYYDSKIEHEKLSDVLARAKYIVLSVPSKVVPYILPYLPKKTPLIVATKGILSDAPFAEFKDWMVLSGPGFAEEIKAREQAFFSITDSRIAELFDANYTDFDLVEDRKGVLMCGALKNIYAIYAGRYNLKPRSLRLKNYIEEASWEMTRILELNGADPFTVYHACGVGDLILTCSPKSRNYEFGQKLKKNPDYQPEKTVEGVSALKRIKRGEIKMPKDLTIMNKIIGMSEKWA